MNLSQLNSKTCFLADSVAVQICKVLAYCSVLLIGLLGNSLLLVIVFKRRELRRTVNYFIVNMALSDFVFPLVGVPIKLTEIISSSSHWRVSGVAGNILCKAYRFSTVASLTVSLQSLVWIAMDRFIAVMFPMKIRVISSKYRAIAIASTWVVALTVRFPYLLIMNLTKDGNQFCVQMDDSSIFTNKTFLNSYNLATVVIFLVVPLVLIISVYLKIAVTLKRRMKHLFQICPHLKIQTRDRNAKPVKMALFMISFYGLCFIPYLISYCQYYVFNGVFPCLFQNVLFFFATFMLYASSTVNPIVCFSFVGSFRLELKKMFNYRL